MLLIYYGRHCRCSSTANVVVVIVVVVVVVAANFVVEDITDHHTNWERSLCEFAIYP